MEVTLTDNDPAGAGLQTDPSLPTEVVLRDGQVRDVSALDADALVALQWDQERAFARLILDAPRSSPQRTEVTCRAYDTVNRIVAARVAAESPGTPVGPVALGLHPRHKRLVVQLLQQWRARGIEPRFFEIGYGSGMLLSWLSQRRFSVAGIEVSAAMREQARQLLGPDHEQDLLLGDFLRQESPEPQNRYQLIFWNDVFEHIAPDEIEDYLRKICQWLVPGGQLMTITPSWHVRPSDVTGDVCPPRTEAAGLHLKEYTLRELSRLLREAGFRRVATPLCVVPSRIVLCGSGLAGCKCWFEPCLEWLPFGLAKLLCRGFGFSYTIATKGDEPSPLR